MPIMWNPTGPITDLVNKVAEAFSKLPYSVRQNLEDMTNAVPEAKVLGPALAIAPMGANSLKFGKLLEKALQETGATRKTITPIQALNAYFQARYPRVMQKIKISKDPTLAWGGQAQGNQAIIGKSSEFAETAAHEIRHIIQNRRNPAIFKDYPTDVTSLGPEKARLHPDWNKYYEHPAEVQARSAEASIKDSLSRFLEDAGSAPAPHHLGYASWIKDKPIEPMPSLVDAGLLNLSRRTLAGLNDEHLAARIAQKFYKKRILQDPAHYSKKEMERYPRYFLEDPWGFSQATDEPAWQKVGYYSSPSIKLVKSR